ncbi:MAG: ATP-binding protein [Solirubrobacterales bacterium]|jgi:signal transduction histidine kinase
MRLLSSLQNRVFVATALLAVIPIGVALHFVSARVTTEVEERLQRGLVESATLVDQHHSARRETLTEMARLMADLPKLKAAISTGDPPTVEPLARDYRARVKSDVFVVTDGTGRVLVALGAAPEAAGRPAVAAALAGAETTAFGVDGGRLLELVTVPVAIGFDPPEVLGTLSLGFALDDALAAQFKSLTGSEVAFALDGRIHASTLPRTEDSGLPAVLAARGTTVIALGETDYAALARPLGASGTPTAIILRSRAEGLRFLDTLRAALFVAAVAGVAIAVLLSYAVARTVTRPLAAITAAMREIAATGDLTRKIALGRAWDDEDARLLARTFNTLTDSIAGFQGKAALRDRLSALGRLSTVIAHEVRNPLMIIKASLRTLRGPGLADGEIREAAADIDHEVARLDRIVGDVLDFARPLRLECAPTDLNALCAEAAEAAPPADGDPRIVFHLDPALPPVLTDAERLRTVLVNVLNNARESVRARPPASNGGAPAVEMSTELVSSERAAILVADRGLGIAEDDLLHIFEPYFTTKRTGTGLGLAIAKNIVEALGGVVSARSRLGEGTEIRIDLPTSGPPGTRG